NFFTTSNNFRITRFIGAILFLSILLSFLSLFNIRPCNAQTLGETLEQIRKRASVAEAQVDKQLLEVQARLNSEQAREEIEKQKTQVRNQFLDLLNNEERYKQALENPNIPQYQKNLLRKFKANLQELNKFIDEQSDPKYLALQRKLQIRKDRELAEKRAKERALRNRLSHNNK
ncbi:MAG: hypothetical protein AAF349_07580, partial [Cyanobacteria bacterium P01_A01_bin.68]